MSDIEPNDTDKALDPVPFSELLAEFCKKHDLESKTFPLSKPRTIAGIKCESLLVREVLAFDMDPSVIKAAVSDGADEDDVRWIVERACGLTTGDLSYLSPNDYDAIESWVMDFLADAH